MPSPLLLLEMRAAGVVGDHHARNRRAAGGSVARSAAMDSSALAYAFATPWIPSSQLVIAAKLVIDVVALAVPPNAVQPSALALAPA